MTQRSHKEIGRKTLTLAGPQKRASKRTVSKKQIAKQKLMRLNRSGLPVIRDFRLSGPRPDMAVLWAAYLRGGFDLGDGLTQEEFEREVELLLNTAYNFVVVEDFNSIANGDMAPICVIQEKFDGWMVEPHIEWFPWATKRNKLRTVVNYLRSLRSHEVYATVLIKSMKEHVDFFNGIIEYGVLHKLSQFNDGKLIEQVGRIVGGDPRGDIYLYSMLCNRAMRNKK